MASVKKLALTTEVSYLGVVILDTGMVLDTGTSLETPPQFETRIFPTLQ